MRIFGFTISRHNRPVVVHTFKTKKDDWQQIHEAKNDQLRRELAIKNARAGNAQHDHFADQIRGALGGGA